MNNNKQLLFIFQTKSLKFDRQRWQSVFRAVYSSGAAETEDTLLRSVSTIFSFALLYWLYCTVQCFESFRLFVQFFRSLFRIKSAECEFSYLWDFRLPTSIIWWLLIKFRILQRLRQTGLYVPQMILKPLKDCAEISNAGESLIQESDLTSQLWLHRTLSSAQVWQGFNLVITYRYQVLFPNRWESSSWFSIN